MVDAAKIPKRVPTRRPAINPEARENQLVAMAVDLAEQQLSKGTASSQVITHFLKLGTMKEKLEREILEQQKELYAAKTNAIKSAARAEELYTTALEAMRSYSAQPPEGYHENLRGDD